MENFEDARGADKSDENTPVDIDIEEHVSDNSSSQVESQERPERQPTAPKPVQLEEPRPVPAPIARRRPVPVAPGRAADAHDASTAQAAVPAILLPRGRHG